MGVREGKRNANLDACCREVGLEFFFVYYNALLALFTICWLQSIGMLQKIPSSWFCGRTSEDVSQWIQKYSVLI